MMMRASCLSFFVLLVTGLRLCPVYRSVTQFPVYPHRATFFFVPNFHYLHPTMVQLPICHVYERPPMPQYVENCDNSSSDFHFRI
ncbi:hypothetical protein Hdeb2414_s0006g00216751 [Helianthus debilis subsp. tardiflorus]